MWKSRQTSENWWVSSMRKLWTAMNVPMNIGKSMDNRRTWMTKMAPFPASWFCRTPGAIFVENDPRLSPPFPVCIYKIRLRSLVHSWSAILIERVWPLYLALSVLQNLYKNSWKRSEAILSDFWLHTHNVYVAGSGWNQFLTVYTACFLGS